MLLWLLLFPCCSFHLICLDTRGPWDPDFDASRRALMARLVYINSGHGESAQLPPPASVPHGNQLPDQALACHHQLPCTDWAIGPLPLQLPDDFYPLPRSPLIRKETDGKQAKVYVNAEVYTESYKNLCVVLSRTVPPLHFEGH
jgi:hypothetical protein